MCFCVMITMHGKTPGCMILDQIIQTKRIWCWWHRTSPLTSVFFLYVLKFLLARILSFLTLCVIPWLDHPPNLKEDLSCLGMCSVCCFPVFSLTWESQSSWRDTVRCLTVESSMWAEQQREKEIRSTLWRSTPIHSWRRILAEYCRYNCIQVSQLPLFLWLISCNKNLSNIVCSWCLREICTPNVSGAK